MPSLIYLVSDRGVRNIALFTWIILLSSLHIVWGIFNADELKIMNYEVDILNSPILANKDVDLPILHMTSKFGQQYQCMLPQVLPVSEETGTGTKETTDTEIPEIQELLKPLYNGPCLIKPKDWWTYELCVGQSIRQYHIEDSQVIGAVPNLGIYDSDYDWSSQKDKNGYMKLKQPRFHSQYYVNGTNCDLTGKPRTTEVRFFCEVDAGDYISRVDEPETCHYIFTVHTDRVCSHPYLKPAPSTKPHKIKCNPVLQEENYAKYMQRAQEVQEKAEKKRQEWIGQQQKQLEELKLRLQKDRNNLRTKVPEVEVVNLGSVDDDEDEEEDSELSQGVEELTDKEQQKLISEMIKFQKDFDSLTDQSSSKAQGTNEMTEKEELKLLLEMAKIRKDFGGIFNQMEDGMQQEVEDGGGGKKSAYSNQANPLNTVFSSLKKTENDFVENSEHFKKIYQLLENLQGVNKKVTEGTTEEEEETLLKEKAKILLSISKEIDKNSEEAMDEGQKVPNKGRLYTHLVSTLDKMIAKLNKAEADVAQASAHFKKVQKYIHKLEISKERIQAMPVEEQVKLLIERAKLQNAIINGFDNIPDEADDLPEPEVEEGSDEPPTVLASTLNTLIAKLEKGEKDLSQARTNYKKIQNHLVNLQETKKKLLKDEPEEVQDGEQEENGEDEEIGDEEESENESKLMPDFDNKVQVRIRKIPSENKNDDGKVHWFRQKDLDQTQKQKLEEAVRDKLEKAGLDAGGRKIEVKIITAGYYNDDEDGKSFHVLSDEETQQFQNMILTLLTGSQEARKEMERQRQMEKNYQFVWNEDQPLTEETEES